MIGYVFFGEHHHELSRDRVAAPAGGYSMNPGSGGGANAGIDLIGTVALCGLDQGRGNLRILKALGQGRAEIPAESFVHAVTGDGCRILRQKVAFEGKGADQERCIARGF